MPKYTIKIFGTDWCGDCHRAKRFLKDNGVEFLFINIDEDRAGEQFVLEVNKGLRCVPTIIFGDGSILVEPSNAELGHRLGITVTG